MKTLIIIDVQNDFMSGGSLAVPGAEAIILMINSFQNHCDLIVATQDWHPAKHKSFASNHPERSCFETIQWQGMEQTLWPDHCVQNSFGADFHPKLNTAAVEAIFRKGTNAEIDSYSAFYDNAHKKSTGLAGYLRDKGAKDLYFCGLAADICVYFSIKDALQEGFNCYLLEEAVSALNEDNFKQLKKELQEQGVKIMNAIQ